jgi:signal peptidase I
MIFDFAFYLTLAVLVTGIIALVDQLFFKKRRGKKKAPLIVTYARDFFPILLVVWAVRSFVIQPYRVPTGSLEPTVLPGDFIAVEQFAYGFRFPVWDKKIISVETPKHGQIALFRYPKNPKMVYVKRVIGLPGDHIVYKDKTLYINGKKQEQTFLSHALDMEYPNNPIPVDVMEETLDGIKHKIYIQPDSPNELAHCPYVDVRVPKGHYFMMGDNRDNSEDSRCWGFVPDKNLIGRAFITWMSWDPEKHKIRWKRIGTKL